MGFLFGSRGGDSQTTTQIQKTELPPYVQGFSERMLGRAEQLAAQPFVPYTAPRVAPVTRSESMGMQLAQLGAGKSPAMIERAQQPLSAALATTDIGGWQGAMAGYGHQAAQPWHQSAAAPAMKAALRNQEIYNARSATPWWEGPNATAISRLMADAERASAAGARGWTDIGQAGQQAYINPYMRNVADVAAEEAARLYGITNKAMAAKAASAGAFGSDNYGTQQAESQRNLGQQVSNIYRTTMADAYNTATQLYGQDAARRMALGGQLESLAGQRLSADAQARAQQAQAAQGELARLGAYGGLHQQDIAGRLGAANVMAQGGQNQLAQAAERRANAMTMADIGKAYQGARTMDIENLLRAGGIERGVNQASLDATRGAFEEARMWPYQQINFGIGALSGTPYATSTSSSGRQAERPGVSSGIAEMAGLALTGLGLGRLFL